ncbi:hypothetical protein QBC38DRAFT_545745 [Podospora fimiseda]|uniref:Uncharacterized protein n=1 Tax=Podospora fimiseda TaxID=252190 RepID=A0AAN7GY18_9PEZI|nr:hypothetical protein QBC38DRAFT_545745 [Podospora fimiseda]
MPRTGDYYPHGSEIDQTPYLVWTDHVTGAVQSTAGALLPPNYQKADDDALPWICLIRSYDDAAVLEFIEMVTGTRRYSEWQDENSKPIEMKGALIPEGYQLEEREPDRPWVCPVRSCRMLCENSFTLGFHFARIHKSAELNDNDDGTFSIVGTYAGQAPRVVSKRPLDPNEPPIVEPWFWFKRPGRSSEIIRIQDSCPGFVNAKESAETSISCQPPSLKQPPS